MPKIENNEENDTSETRVTRSLRKRLPVNDTDSPKKNTKSSVAKMSKEAEKDQEKDMASTAMSETRKTRASRSDSPQTTKPDESVPKTPARRLTRRASATEDLAAVSTPTRRSRRISHDDVNVLKASVDKPLTRSRRTPVPISEETEPVEREEAASPGVRTRSMTVSPHPQMSSRRNSRPERCKTPSEPEKVSKKKDESENVSKEEEETKDEVITEIDETEEPTAKEEPRSGKKSDQEGENKENSPKVEEKTEHKSQEKDENKESLEVDSRKETEVTNNSTKDNNEESEKSSKLESSSTLDENETNASTSKEAISKEKDKVSNVDPSEFAKNEEQSEIPQPIKTVSFHASTQEQEKSPSRFPKTPILSKSRSYVDKPLAKKGNLSDEEKALNENFCMDTSDIPVEVNPSSTETPKLGLKRCLSAMTSSTPIDSIKNEKALKNAKKEKLQVTGSILPGTPDDEDVSMEEKSDVRDETPAMHPHDEPKPGSSKSETTEVKIPKRSINFEAESTQEAVKVSEIDEISPMDVVQEVDEDLTKAMDKKENSEFSTVEVSKDIPKPKDTSKEKENEQKTSPTKTRNETTDPKDVASPAGVNKEKEDKQEVSSGKNADEKDALDNVANSAGLDKEKENQQDTSSVKISAEKEGSKDVANSTGLDKEKENQPETSSLKISAEKEASKNVVSSAAGNKDKEGKEEASAAKIVDEKANESDSNEMVIDANDDDTVEMDTLMFSKETQLQTKEGSDKPETSTQMRQSEERTDSKEESSSTSAVQDETKKGSPFSKSWSHAVKGTPALDGKNFIDGLGVLDKKEEKVIHSAKKPAKAPLPSQKEDEDEDLEGEEEYYEEEEEEEKNDFIDDEAEENSQDSMDSSEREYLRQNEIPEEGESIGSDDTESIAEDDDDGDEEEEEEEENASFIVSDEEEAQFSMDTDEDDFLLTKKNKTKKKERKRIRQLDESTDEEAENADKPKNDVDIIEKIEDGTKDGSGEVLKEGDGEKDSENNEAEPSKENPAANDDEIPSKQNEAAVEERVAELTERNKSQAVSSTETRKAENETSHKVDKNVNSSEDISKDRNESSAEMESTTPFDASVIGKRNIPVRMEEETVDDISPSQESETMERLRVESETVENDEATQTQEGTTVIDQGTISSVPQEVESERVPGKTRNNISSGSNSSADDERSGNEQVKTKKIENQKKMKVSKDQQEKSDESSDSDTIVFTSTLLAPSASKKKDPKTNNDKTSESVDVQEENPNDKQISNNKKKKKKKEAPSSTQVEVASKSKKTAPEAVETTQTEVSNETAPSAKQDKKKRTRSVEDASKYDSILLRCEQMLRTQEEIKKKARLENKPKKVKKNKKQKVNEETNVLESKNHEVVQTAPKLKQSLHEPKSKNLNVIEQNSDDNHQDEEDAFERLQFSQEINDLLDELTQSMSLRATNLTTGSSDVIEEDPSEMVITISDTEDESDQNAIGRTPTSTELFTRRSPPQVDHLDIPVKRNFESLLDGWNEYRSNISSTQAVRPKKGRSEQQVVLNQQYMKALNLNASLEGKTTLSQEEKEKLVWAKAVIEHWWHPKRKRRVFDNTSDTEAKRTRTEEVSEYRETETAKHPWFVGHEQSQTSYEHYAEEVDEETPLRPFQIRDGRILPQFDIATTSDANQFSKRDKSLQRKARARQRKDLKTLKKDCFIRAMAELEEGYVEYSFNEPIPSTDVSTTRYLDQQPTNRKSERWKARDRYRKALERAKMQIEQTRVFSEEEYEPDPIDEQILFKPENLSFDNKETWEAHEERKTVPTTSFWRASCDVFDCTDISRDLPTSTVHVETQFSHQINYFNDPVKEAGESPSGMVINISDSEDESDQYAIGQIRHSPELFTRRSPRQVDYLDMTEKRDFEPTFDGWNESQSDSSVTEAVSHKKGKFEQRKAQNRRRRAIDRMALRRQKSSLRYTKSVTRDRFTRNFNQHSKKRKSARRLALDQYRKAIWLRAMLECKKYLSQADEVTLVWAREEIERGRKLCAQESPSKCAQIEEKVLLKMLKKRSFPSKRRRGRRKNKRRDAAVSPVNDIVTDHLTVAIIDRSDLYGRMSPQRWRIVEDALLDKIRHQLEFNEEQSLPTCVEAGWYMGVKLINCSDQYSLEWCRTAVSTLGTLWEGAQLEVVAQSEIPREPFALVYIPRIRPTAETLKLLRRQNPDIPTEDWTVLKIFKPSGSENLGQTLLLQINKIAENILYTRKGKMAWGLENVYLHLKKRNNEVGNENTLEPGEFEKYFVKASST